MKKTILLIIFLVLDFLIGQAQDYLINFAGTGDTNAVTSIKVDNLTRNTSVTLNGGDILHLTGNVGIGDIKTADGRLQIYPNPMAEKAILTFKVPESSNTLISISDLSGRTVYETNKLLTPGSHSFRIYGIDHGIYIVRIIGSNFNYSGKLTSQGLKHSQSKIEYVYSDNSTIGNRLKSTTSTIEMPYAEGDILLYTSISGQYSTVITDVPTGSRTMTFNFTACTDSDKNNYPTVKIFNQVWMARNLAYLPSVSPSTVNSYTTPVYYVHGYQGTSVEEAKTNPNYSTYGVLYNWEAAKTACPSGWHLPSDAEWTTMTNYLGLAAGGMMKETGIIHWKDPNIGATNESGFTALPAGARDDISLFGSLSRSTYLWSSSPVEPSAAWYIYMTYQENVVHRTYCYRVYGFSVRCIKDY